MIRVSHLTKRYGDNLAVSDLSFTIEAGHIYGFLGPNGAGKSTVMNMIAGCLAASEGQVLIDGHDIFEDSIEAKRCIGYLPELPPVYLDMTPREYLRFVAEAKGLSRTSIPSQIATVMEKTDITSVADRLCRNLSKGYRQRVGISQVLLGNPKVIILDEPTVGLDPKQIIDIRYLIRELGREHTVILSSHIISEIRATCDRVMIISHGKIVAADTPDNLESLFAKEHTIVVKVKAGQDALRAAIPKDWDAHYGWVNDATTELTITTKGDRDLREEVFFACSDARLPILEMTYNQASLEDVFLKLTDGDKEIIEISKKSEVDE